MSAATVRDQLKAFLTTPAIPGLERMYRSEPWFAGGENWNLADQSGWGAIGWPWISDDSEERITLAAQHPGASGVGQKHIAYKVRIVLLYQFLIPEQLNAGEAEDAWQAPLDTLIENIKQRLRSDPKAGTAAGLGDVIQQQSQEPGDLKVMRDPPKLSKGGGKVICWTGIDTTVIEIITA